MKYILLAASVTMLVGCVSQEQRDTMIHSAMDTVLGTDENNRDERLLKLLEQKDQLEKTLNEKRS